MQNADNALWYFISLCKNIANHGVKKNNCLKYNYSEKVLFSF